MAEGLLQAMGRKCILLNVPSWQETKNVCGLVSNFLTRQETSVVSVALLSLWLTVCVEGSKSPQYATEIFKKILRKNKILPQPPRTQTKKGTKEKESFKFKGFQMFSDDSGHTDSHLGGAGFAVFREGKEICGGFETIPLGSNNIGVFDILLVSLKKKYNPQDLSGFMDDLGMVLQKAETINSLTPTFKKYEEVTGAKLNFNKCFVLSTESFKPVGPWAEMARSNYCGDETVYLGVKLSKQLSLLKDWRK